MCWRVRFTSAISQAMRFHSEHVKVVETPSTNNSNNK